MASTTQDQTSPHFYSPSQTALFLLDFHTLFVEKAGGASAVSSKDVAAETRRWAHSKNIQVIHCLIDLHESPFPTCKDLDKFAGILGTLQAANDVEPAELTNGDGNDVTFTRRAGHVSALKSKGLEEYLEGKGIRSLALAGLSTT